MRTNFSLIPRMDYGRCIQRLPYPFVLLMFCISSVCLSAADPACISQVRITLNDNGDALLYPSMFVRGNSSAYKVSPTMVSCSDAGQSIMVTLTDTMTQEVCMSTLYVEDKSEFEIILRDTLVDCVVDLDSIADLFTIVDNCLTIDDVSYSYIDVIDSIYNGNPDTLRVMKRIWQFQSGTSKTMSFESFIALARFDTSMIVFPADDTVYCPQNVYDTDITGEPTFKGLSLMDQCDVMLSTVMLDSIPQGCDANVKFTRLWIVMDWSTRSTWRDTQTIYRVDTVQRVLSLPQMISYTENLIDCNVSLVVPAPEISGSGCASDENLQLEVLINNSPARIGDTVSVDFGQVIFEYSGLNDCLEPLVGFVDTLMFSDSGGVDLECSAATSVVAIGLTDNNDRTVWVENIWSGNASSCAPYSIVGRRMSNTCTTNDTTFTKQITLCSDDIGEMVMVEINAMDTAGNLVAESCMLMVDVQDKRSVDSLVSGMVKANGADAMAGVELILRRSDESLTVYTDDNGQFLVKANEGDEIEVSVKYQDAIDKGITANDVYLLESMISGVYGDADHYKRLSGDLDQNGYLNGRDILILKQRVLGLHTGSDSDESSWLFFPASNTKDPIISDAPSVFTTSPVANTLIINGVKRGDIDGDAVNSAGTRSGDTDVYLDFDSDLLIPGSWHTLNISSAKDLNAMQMDLVLPYLSDLEIEDPRIAYKYKDDVLRLVVSCDRDIHDEPIRIKVKVENSISIDNLVLTDQFLDPLAFHNDRRHGLKLIKRVKSSDIGSFNPKIFPNPSGGRAYLNMSLVNDFDRAKSDITIEVYDQIGRIVNTWRYSDRSLSDLFPFEIDSDLPKGTYIVSLNMGDVKHKLKYVKL